MSGSLGDLIIDGPLGDFPRVLATAQTCSTGSHAALAMGCFELILQ